MAPSSTATNQSKVGSATTQLLTVERRVHSPLDVGHSVINLGSVYVKLELDVVERHTYHIALLDTRDLPRRPVRDVYFVEFLLVVADDVVAAETPRELVHTSWKHRNESGGGLRRGGTFG